MRARRGEEGASGTIGTSGVRTEEAMTAREDRLRKDAARRDLVLAVEQLG